jgi:hypothetical protein
VLFLPALFLLADLQAGTAAVDITPPAGVPMAGYYYVRYNQGTHDPLHAKALVFSLDGVKAAMVTLDLIGIPRDAVEKARILVEGLTAVPGAHLMVSATHSHTGPELSFARVRGADAEAERKLRAWINALPGRIAEAVRLAEANLQPARVRSATGHEDSISFIRRYRMADGSTGWNPGKLNPRIVAPIGSIDPAVPALFIENLRREPMATYVNFANHLDTVGGLRYSADYAFTLSNVLNAAANQPGHVTLFTIGCAGNINHVDVRRADAQKGDGEAARIGGILAGAVLKSQVAAKPVATEAGLRVRTGIVKLPLAPFRPEEVTAARETLASYGAPNARPFPEQVNAFKVLELDARKGQPIEAEVQVVTLGGEVAIVGLPGEIFVDLGKAVKAGSKYPTTIVVALANGSIGYVPDRQAYAEGAYEVISSRVAEGGGEKLVEAALRLLQ